MKILHHGAVNGVTGSCHELRIGGSNEFGILIDCGLFQGDEVSGKGASGADLSIDFPIDDIKALVVTHVHIDHVGRIPYLLAAGFKGPIICSEPSAQLLPLVLEDAVKIGFTRNERLVDHFLEEIEQRIIALPYGKWFDLSRHLGLTENLSVKLKPAGHILGSAYVECRLGSGREAKKVIFSGDLGAPYSPLLSSPKPPYSCDFLVIESTYGDKQHEGRRSRRERLRRVIERALKDKGVVLVPAFSIGRTQELLYEFESIIHQYAKQDRGDGLAWEDMEIIVDSPLANKFTQVYQRLESYWDAEAHKRVASGRHPLSFEQLTTINEHSDHERAVAYLKKTARPTIVIAASGMCAGGRVMNYLKALLSDERTDILFVGYQAKGTPGNDIQKYGPRGGYVELDGQKYWIKAQVHSLSGYSAHADQKNLLDFVKRMRRKPSQIRIVHGDDEAKSALKLKYEALLGEDCHVVIPNG